MQIPVCCCMYIRTKRFCRKWGKYKRSIRGSIPKTWDLRKCASVSRNPLNIGLRSALCRAVQSEMGFINEFLYWWRLLHKGWPFLLVHAMESCNSSKQVRVNKCTTKTQQKYRNFYCMRILHLFFPTKEIAILLATSIVYEMLFHYTLGLV